MKKVGVHKRSEIRVVGDLGNEFAIKIRQSVLNLLDFSVILCYEYKEKTSDNKEIQGSFILGRYNGKSHWHTNKIEKSTFRDFHIHYATERYQLAGHNVEGFAVAMSRYSDLAGALSCMIADCNFEEPSNSQMRLL